MAYTWVVFPLTSTPNFEFEARDALETWRQNAEDMETRLTAIDNETVGMQVNTLNGDKLLINTVSGHKLQSTNSASGGYYLVWNEGSGMFDWVDNTVNGSRLVDDTVTKAKLDAMNSPADLQIMRWNNTSGQFEWVDPTAAADTFQVSKYNGDTPDFLDAKIGVNNGAPSLFINPNFKVNQRGYAQDGTALTSGDYAADCWETVSTSGLNGITVSPDGTIVLGSDAELTQVTEDLEEFNGFQVTCSVESGTIYIKDMVLGATEVTAGNPHTWTLSTSATIGVSILSNGAQRTIQGLKLEIGAVKTPYERPQPAVEKLKCYEYYYNPDIPTLVSLSPQINPNLLINPDLAINQIEYGGGALSNDGQLQDMWRANNPITSVSVSGQEITVDCAENSGIDQVNEELNNIPGNTLLTASVEIISGSANFVGSGAQGAGSSSMGVGYHTFTWAKNPSYHNFGIVNTGTGAFTYKNFKLEEGVTATPYTKPVGALEEPKCMWYFERIGGDRSGKYFIGYVRSGVTYLPITWHPKRVSGSDLTFNRVGTHRVYSNHVLYAEATIWDFSIATTECTSTGAHVTIQVDEPSHLLYSAMVSFSSTNYLDVDARL